jgi:glutaconate CoA-transferase subunit A
VILPSWVLDAVCCVPGGARPSYALGFYDRDNDFYIQWDTISRDRDTFRAWIDRHVLATRDHAEHLQSLEAGR